MVRTRNVLACLAAVALCLAAVALAKAVKQDLVDADGNQVGKANLNYAKGADKTECQVNCWDLEPETEYTVLLCECENSECIELGSLATNKKGNGHLHASIDGDVSGWCVVVGVMDNDGYVTPCFSVVVFDLTKKIKIGLSDDVLPRDPYWR